jgi:hypothetical protein
MEDEPVKGQRQVVLRVPADWSGRRAMDWARYVHSKTRPTTRSGTPLAQHRGGRLCKVTHIEAIEVARRFDTQLAAQRLEQRRARRLPRKLWIVEFDSWLKDGDEARFGTASSMWKLHLRSAIVGGELALASLDYQPRSRRRQRDLRSSLTCAVVRQH